MVTWIVPFTKTEDEWISKRAAFIHSNGLRARRDGVGVGVGQRVVGTAARKLGRDYTKKAEFQGKKSERHWQLVIDSALSWWYEGVPHRWIDKSKDDSEESKEQPQHRAGTKRQDTPSVLLGDDHGGSDCRWQNMDYEHALQSEDRLLRLPHTSDFLANWHFNLITLTVTSNIEVASLVMDGFRLGVKTLDGDGTQERYKALPTVFDFATASVRSIGPNGPKTTYSKVDDRVSIVRDDKPMTGFGFVNTLFDILAAHSWTHAFFTIKLELTIHFAHGIFSYRNLYPCVHCYFSYCCRMVQEDCIEGCQFGFTEQILGKYKSMSQPRANLEYYHG
ncbi:hypothetical protein EV421DRAFT_2025076 [Armillaria borealis]|uniref:Uncharacterized protein n=1 Tax=Armillaria borealis TaxID=47425 RepID=A0AA39IU33_9AGAR|nr:hypothetical protein EV421DRAFT_2025076 [Armillaria borealis]